MPNTQVNQNESPLEIIRQIIKQLSHEEQLQVRSMLDENVWNLSPPSLDYRTPPAIPPEEFAVKWELERQWLAEHRREYAGCWVALDGDRLIAAGSSAKDVYAMLKASGVSGAMVLRVEHPDDLPVLE